MKLTGTGYNNRKLSDAEVRAILTEGLAQVDLSGKRILAVIPDSTRTAPLPLMFRLFHDILFEQVSTLDFLVALGTHQPMNEDALNKLVGITAAERSGQYAGVKIFNHLWEDAETFVTLGTITAAETAAISDGMLTIDVPVRINRAVEDYDQIIICGPVFPHEVAGFSGGYKYFFPGISGPEVINFTHWLGALITSYDVIGTKSTPIRDVIHRAASYVKTPTLACCMILHEKQLNGLYMGDVIEAWSAAADLSAQLHVTYLEEPVKRVLSILPEMYDDLWTGAKGMYKLEPVIADGGEVVIYAPNITEISYTHGKILDEVGYHVRDYFVKQWDKFSQYPWGVIAHSTHLRGIGTYADGVEQPRIKVTLATNIPPERCKKVGLGYLDPATIDIRAWENRSAEGILVVQRAGEMLYRLKK